MGRKSTRENKTPYQVARENMSLTLESAGELLNMDKSRLNRIERNENLPHPDEVISMGKCYKEPELCNYYCANECPVGRQYVPEVRVKALEPIALSLLSSLNEMDKKKERLIDIAEDGVISDDETKDLIFIQDLLEKASVSIEGLQLWVEKMKAKGQINEKEYDAAYQKLHSEKK